MSQSHISTSVWLKDILPRTPGCVRAVAKRELILTAREFYRDSYAWQDATHTYFSSGEYQFTLVSPDAEAEIVQVLAVESNGLPLRPVTQRPSGERELGTPLYWYPCPHDGHDIEIWPTPDQYEDTILTRVVLMPLATATTLPHMAGSKHYDALLDGVLGRLYAHPAKPYSNPQLGEYHLKRFRAAISAAAGAMKGGGFAGQNWRFPRFVKN